MLAQWIAFVESLADVSEGMEGSSLVFGGAMSNVPDQPFDCFGVCVMNQSHRPGCAPTDSLVLVKQEFAQRG